MSLTLCKANQELVLASKEENNKTIETMWDELILLPNLMADPRFYGTSLLMTGTREWTDYTVSSLLTPHLCSRFGLAARAQGLQRFYALLLCSDGKARLIKALDGEIVLAEIPFEWHLGETYSFELTVTGSQIRGSINEYLVVDVSDQQDVLTGGCIALVCSEGRMGTDSVRVDNCKA